MVRSHLGGKRDPDRLKGMNRSEQEFYSQMLPMNRQLVSEIEQINAYLRSRPHLLNTGYSRMPPKCWTTWRTQFCASS